MGNSRYFLSKPNVSEKLDYYESKAEVDGYCLLRILVGEQDKFEIEGTVMERNELVI